MVIASYLLLVLAMLGGTDIVLFHSIAHGIRRHADARIELVVHSLRGPVYALLFLVLPNLTLFGAYWRALVGLLFLDLLITVVDFAIERRSRQLLGGIPTGEYLLHLWMALIFGGLSAAVWFESSAWRLAPSAIAYSPVAVPWGLRLALACMAILVLASGIIDAVAASRLRGRIS